MADELAEARRKMVEKRFGNLPASPGGSVGAGTSRQQRQRSSLAASNIDHDLTRKGVFKRSAEPNEATEIKKETKVFLGSLIYMCFAFSDNLRAGGNHVWADRTICISIFCSGRQVI